jgi:hypothetical protein
MCLRVLKEDLQRCECEICSGIKYWRFFKDASGRSKWENVVEMFGILMERECETIRRKWNKKFAAHAVGIEGVANIHAYTIFGQWWQERRDEECAWRG